MGRVADSEDEDFVIFGIDFGTTYSGVAWATGREIQNNRENLVTGWKGEGTQLSDRGKAPTVLYYAGDQIYWGYEVPKDAEPIRWFKLLLLRQEDLTPNVRDSEYLMKARKAARELNKSPVDLVADYLRLLWRHVLAQVGKELGEDLLEGLPYRVVLTVPAIWKGYARQAMQAAAEKAGILDRRLAGPTTLDLISEPEAAAVYSLKERSKFHRCKPGQIYVICDAGGGTVDLISYEVRSVEPLLVLGECVEGKGALCGGIFIDEQFESMLKKRLGRRWTRLSLANIAGMIRDEWELNIKQQFDPSEDGKPISCIRIPAEAFQPDGVLDDLSSEPHIKNGNLELKKGHIKSLFSPKFSEIIDLIEEQIDASKNNGREPTGIILVGGLGCSSYLFTTVKDEFASGGVSVLQSSGQYPWTAICRGAVVIAACKARPGPSPVVSRVSRLSFGTTYWTEFDEKTHDLIDKVWDHRQYKWKATNQMHWFLKKGCDLATANNIVKGYHRILDLDDDGQFNVAFWQCEEPEAPSRKTEAVKRLCDIECRLDTPVSLLPPFVNIKGQVFRRLDFQIEMGISGASVEFAVTVDGRQLGKENVSIQFE